VVIVDYWRLTNSGRLITAWLEVRVLPGPPRSSIQTEISRCRANSAELVGFRAGTLVSAYDRLNVTGVFDAAVSVPQNSVSRKPRLTVAQIIAKAVPTAKAGGAQYLAATEKITALVGVPPKRVVILAFDSVDQAKAWYNSPAQQEVNAMDAKAVEHRWYIVDSAM
jgi:uncharacterized protein (DUF1330 family)